MIKLTPPSAHTSDHERHASSEGNVARSLEKWIGQLRAYAVVASGSRDKADAALLEVCNKLVEMNANFGAQPGYDTRTLLYSMVEQHLAGSELTTKPLDNKLFVLMAIEGFSPSETARILGFDEAFVARWAKEVQR